MRIFWEAYPPERNYSPIYDAEGVVAYWENFTGPLHNVWADRQEGALRLQWSAPDSAKHWQRELTRLFEQTDLHESVAKYPDFIVCYQAEGGTIRVAVARTLLQEDPGDVLPPMWFQTGDIPLPGKEIVLVPSDLKLLCSGRRTSFMQLWKIQEPFALRGQFVFAEEGITGSVPRTATAIELTERVTWANAFPGFVRDTLIVETPKGFWRPEVVWVGKQLTCKRYQEAGSTV